MLPGFALIGMPADTGAAADDDTCHAVGVGPWPPSCNLDNAPTKPKSWASGPFLLWFAPWLRRRSAERLTRTC